jgi:hypothetical protein
MFIENRTIHFEELEPRDRKKKKGRSNPFEYNVEVPKSLSSLDKEKHVSEHKEIVPPIKRLTEIREEEKKEEEEESIKEQQLIDQLSITKCPKCSSENVEEVGEEGRLQCTKCKFMWEEKTF